MFIYNKIVSYPRLTLKKATKDVMSSKNRMIAGIYSPSALSLDYEEVEFRSVDGTKLYGWLIKREKAKKTIIMCHGRGSNRVILLKFLKIFIDMNIIDDYNIFLPDLRNSGKSDIKKTGFGYYFSYDIYASMEFLKKNYKLNNFILYGFSQGAMGASLVPKLFKNDLEENNIIVEKLILDSPVSNVKKIIIKNAKIGIFKIPYFVILHALNKFNRFVKGNLSNLRLSKTLGIIPTLIIQSEKDDVTPYEYVISEYNELGDEKRKITKFKAFRKGQHVRIYLQYKEEYAMTIKQFLEGEINE